jgi:hypothetical protein
MSTLRTALKLRDQQILASKITNKGVVQSVPEIVVVEAEGAEVKRLNREIQRLQNVIDK